MIRRAPIIDSAADARDILFAARNANDAHEAAEFTNMLSVIAGARNIYTVNSGIAAFYLTLKAISKASASKEVILPAYTAGSLVVAVRKAGLEPVLCDISLSDFNMDIGAVSKLLSPGTLAVVAVHMFGIGVSGIENLRAALPKEVYLLEDCCQAMGSVVSGHQVGLRGDASFFSFNRCKNLPLGGGGFISTEDVSIAKALESEVAAIKSPAGLSELSALFRILAVSIAVNPFVYGLGRGVISRFKEMAPPMDFDVRRMSSFQAALGVRLLKRMEELSLKRYNNGMRLINALKGADGVLLPVITAGSRPAFNRLPVVFKDLEKRALAEHALAANGIEASRMYLRPLHHMFEMGYERSDFPNADYAAERLLTLPVHPSIRQKDIDRMIAAITGVLR